MLDLGGPDGPAVQTDIKRKGLVSRELFLDLNVCSATLKLGYLGAVAGRHLCLSSSVTGFNTRAPTAVTARLRSGSSRSSIYRRRSVLVFKGNWTAV